MRCLPYFGGCVTLACTILTGQAAQQETSGPQAATRTHVQNYKDMVLAECLAQAWRDEPHATRDAGSSASQLRDWTVYDLEAHPEAIQALIAHYLRRDYSSPIVEAEVAGVRFDFLKCMDLYHSQALQKLAARVVIEPGSTARAMRQQRQAVPSTPTRK